MHAVSNAILISWPNPFVHACCEAPPRHFQSNVVIHLEQSIRKDHGCRPENLNMCVKHVMAVCPEARVPCGGSRWHGAGLQIWARRDGREEAPGDAICQLNQAA